MVLNIIPRKTETFHAKEGNTVGLYLYSYIPSMGDGITWIHKLLEREAQVTLVAQKTLNPEFHFFETHS